MMTHIHIHWGRNPRLVKETRLGIAICGLNGIPHDQLTAHAADATCPKCKGAIEGAIENGGHAQNTHTSVSYNTGKK